MIKSIHALAFLFFLTAFAAMDPVHSQDAPDLISYTLFHDFETGEQFGWDPYPYQQDIGYDALFFTRQSPTWNDSNYALARPVKANDTVELYQGFTRQLNMWTSEQTRFQAKVFFQSDRRPEQLEVALGTFDGRLFTHVIESPEANEWVDVDLPVGAFRDEAGRALQAGEHIEVVKLEANYPIVYYLLTYTMLMDNVQLTGERQRRFVATNPQSTDFEEFDKTILNRHYHAGETLSLQVRPEGDAPLDRVHGRLLDSEGRVVRDGISFERRGGEWVNESIRRFQSSDARGQWQIELTGERSGKPNLEWSVEFLMPGEPVAGHPRLFFTSEELEDRKARLADNPTAQRILENAIEESRAFLSDADVDQYNEASGEPYESRTTEGWTGGPWSGASGRLLEWRNPMYGLVDIIEQGSFLYAFTGDREAGETAREALLKLSAFDHWNSNWMIANRKHVYLYMGRISSIVSYGYDMLHDLMNDGQRALVRDALMEKMVKPFYRDMVEMNRMPSHNTNHIALLARGAGHAATVLYGEDPENPDMEPYLSGILTKFRSYLEFNYGPDGGAGEPFIYQSAATAYAGLLMEALDRNFGVDWAEKTHAKSYYLYPLYAMAHNGRYADFGDGRWVYDRFTNLGAQWFASRLEDPLLLQRVIPFWESGEGGYMAYLWYRDDVEGQPRETLPTSHFIEKNGVQVMRSGWDEESTIISYRAGPHANHFHYDQGTIRMITNGEDLLYDPLYGGNYYENLQFPVYNIQAISKNVMLIDHDSESQKPADYDNGVEALSSWPRIDQTFTGEIADALSSDLAPVYKEKLSKYTRTLLYTKHGPLFLFDRVESVSDDGHIYNWLFHALDVEGEPSITYEDWRVAIDQPEARLTMDVVTPLADGEIIQSDFDEHFVKLNSEENLTEANFLAVLYPEARPSNGRFGARPVTEPIETDRWLGAKVTLNGESDYGLFRTSGQGMEASGSAVRSLDISTVEGFTTDASRFTASFDGSDSLVRYYLEGTTFEGYGQSLSSDVPVTAAVLHHDSGMDLEVDATGSTRLNVTVNERPSRVSLDGSSIRFSYDNGRVSLQVPSGRHDIEIR